MTNPATPPKSGGMPKWLIILLVLLLLIILGCCGGFVACGWACHKVAQSAPSVVPEIGSLATRKAQQEWAAATQKEADAARQAAQNAGGAGGNALPTAGPGGMPGDAGGNPPTPNTGNAGGNPAAAGGAAPAIEYGANNLPTDIPVMAGMTGTGLSGVDRVHNSGGGTFSTKSSPADVTAYYQKQLPGQGWTLSGNTSINNMTTLQFTKPNRTTNVMAIPGDNNTTLVTITFETH